MLAELERDLVHQVWHIMPVTNQLDKTPLPLKRNQMQEPSVGVVLKDSQKGTPFGFASSKVHVDACVGSKIVAHLFFAAPCTLRHQIQPALFGEQVLNTATSR